MEKFWPDPKTRPLLVGPDINQDHGDFGSRVLNTMHDKVDAFSYHLYTGFGLSETLAAEMMDITFYAQLEMYIQALRRDIKDSIGTTEVWVGESAAAWYR